MAMKMAAKTVWLLSIMLIIISPGSAQQDTKDIRNLTQQFVDPKSTSPWMFVPQDNIKSISETEHPGFVTILHGEQGKDIKGILKDPIKIDDYPLPWEFHLGVAGGSYTAPYNWAMGLNLVLTFSDPATWPKDRTKLPPDTHSFQLLDVHLKGSQIESGPLNYYSPYSSPVDSDSEGHGGDPYVEATGARTADVWMLYGRGDLDPNVMGNWKIPYNWLGYPEGVWGDMAGGPVSHSLDFRVKLLSPTSLEVGFWSGLQGEPHMGWRMRTIDVSRFGKITGIWEIGPITSLSRWLADDLPPELGISSSPPFQVSDPAAAFMVDYAVFFGASAENYDHFSDDFNTPGFSSKWYHESAAITDTYTNPGYLTVTLLPQAGAAWAMCPTAIGQRVDLTKKKDFPGYEMELGWIPPDDETFPWKLYLTSVAMWTESGRKVGYGGDDPGGWTPGVAYFPKEKRHRFVNYGNVAGTNSRIDVKFDPEVPESILGHKPLYMLMQIPDSSHLRLGFKANKGDPWYLSKPFDVSKVFGEKIGSFDPFVCIWGGVSKGTEGGASGIGNFPRYPRFLIDYVRYGKGLTTPK
jgi:hypothetical protein